MSQTLAKAFSELTGIKLKHDLIQEGDVVEKLQTQMQSGKNRSKAVQTLRSVGEKVRRFVECHGDIKP